MLDGGPTSAPTTSRSPRPACDAAALRRLLAADPALANARGRPVRVAAAALPGLRAPRPGRHRGRGARRGGRLLLEAGADPGAGYLWHGLRRRSPRSPALRRGRGRTGQPAARTRSGRRWPGCCSRPAPTPTTRRRSTTGCSGPTTATSSCSSSSASGPDGGRGSVGWAGRDGSGEMLAGQLAWAVLHGMDARVELLAAHGVDPDTEVGDFGGAAADGVRGGRRQRAGADRRAAAPARRLGRARSATSSGWSPRCWPPTGPRSSDWRG